tara:strand:- start:90 stop:470 length:381 start_codon:yes stop_codon:yes gene_type:complete
MYKDNLWMAILAVLKSKSLDEFILNMDRLGNALCSGNYETTVSGRVGYFALIKKGRYWLALQKIIDNTFYPIDGRKHCLRVYQWERGKGLNHRRGNDVALGFLSILIFIACLFLMPIVWIISFFRK